MDEKRYLTREEIEKADDRPWQDVPTPELGKGTFVRVRMMSAVERDSWEQAHNAAGGVNITAIILVHTLVEPTTGAPLYPHGTQEEEQASVAALGAKSQAWTTRAAKAAVALNDLDNRSVETAEKN
jgi:hypothetical protein